MSIRFGISARRPAALAIWIWVVSGWGWGSLGGWEPPGISIPEARTARMTAAGSGSACEVSVAIDPTNRDRMIAAALTFSRGGGGPYAVNRVYRTEDGGRTWETAEPSIGRGDAGRTGDRVRGDDVVAFGPDGTAHHGYIAFLGIRDRRPSRVENGIFLESSRDGGATWSAPVPVIDHVNTVEPFEDKPGLAVDPRVEGRGAGSIHVVWSRFDVYGSRNSEHRTWIHHARSDDGGATFGPPTRVSDEPGDAVDDDGTLMGASVAVDGEGGVNVAWAGPRGILFDRSEDGGRTFGKDVLVSETPGGWTLEVGGLQTHNGLPTLGVDTSEGPGRGTLYAVWVDARNGEGDYDVFLSSSRDKGATWSPARRVNDDAEGNGRHQLFATLAVDPRDGSVNVGFLDRRDGDGSLIRAALARSEDGGRTFANHVIASSAFRAGGGVFIGDYLGIDARNGRVALAYPRIEEGTRTVFLESAVFDFDAVGGD